MKTCSSPSDAVEFRFPSLQLARLRFTLRAEQSCALPAYLGSTLRGAFGHALKQASCSIRHGECARCPLAEACTYPLVFEGTLRQSAHARRDTPPHPFVLRPPALRLNLRDDGDDRYSEPGATTCANRFKSGDELTFEIILIGEAVARTPYVAHAVEIMAAHGLGAARTPFQLARVAEITPAGTHRDLYCAARAAVALPTAATLTDFVIARLQNSCFQNSSDDRTADDDSFAVRLLTPMRLRVEGTLQARLDFELLLRNVMRRLHLLLHEFSPEPFDADYQAMLALAAHIRTRHTRLAWCDLERYSNRQQGKQKLGGFLGEVEYAGEDLHSFIPLMLAGEILHVGASTVFGLGRYEIAG